MLKRQGSKIALLLMVAILLVLVAFVWLGQVRRKNKPLEGQSLFDQLSDGEQAEWEKITQALVRIAQSGGGDGPEIGQVIDLSSASSLTGKPIDTSEGIYAIMSGFTECGVCQFLLDKFPVWERELGIQTLFIGTGDFSKLDPAIDVIAKGVAQVTTEGQNHDAGIPDELFNTQYGLDPLGFFSTGFVLLDKGRVVFKALGNTAEQRYNIDEIVRVYTLEGTLPQGIEHLSYGKMPDTSIELTLLDGSSASLPKDFGEGIDIVYIFEPRCNLCEVATDGMLESLAAMASEARVPFSVWVIGYDDAPVTEGLRGYAETYPLLKVGVVSGVAAQTKGGHPLQAWSRILIPEFLVFQKGLFVANVPALSMNWGSKPKVTDATPYIEAAKRVVQSLATEN